MPVEAGEQSIVPQGTIDPSILLLVVAVAVVVTGTLTGLDIKS